MKCNVGKTEKIVRALLGLVFLWMGFTYNPWWYLLAVVMFVTAAIGWCPLTAALGINTCKKSEDNSDQSNQQSQEDDAPKENESSEEEPSIESWKEPEQK